MKILGLMCGTSFDGVDAAILEIENGEIIAFGPSHFEPMLTDERTVLRAALGTWNASADVLDVIHNVHNRAIEAIGDDYDYVGFHGQTLAHDPANGRTYQAGDPTRLNVSCPMIYDFRSADVKAGGEGAPLVPIYHYALCAKSRVLMRPWPL